MAIAKDGNILVDVTSYLTNPPVIVTHHCITKLFVTHHCITKLLFVTHRCITKLLHSDVVCEFQYLLKQSDSLSLGLFIFKISLIFGHVEMVHSRAKIVADSIVA